MVKPETSTKERLNSLIEIKKELKKYRIDNALRFPAIEYLNKCFKKYIYGHHVNKDIPFPEFNRIIIVRLDVHCTDNNLVVLKKI